ncbi:glycoside hydrolase family 97 catalytic domain-containing protein [Caulobacter sp. LjRoot300]|uniref:glycoside hydrolase family 97 protein n=1 Tax=Caulobacter sp. LjRoot300 TaxID=3342321 RepID=UPI003ED100EA
MVPVDRRRFILLAAAAAAPFSVASATLAKPRPAAAPLRVVSPDGRVRLELDARAGALAWSVLRDGRAVLGPSRLGLVLADGRPLGAGATVVSVSRRRLTGTWTPTFGIRDAYDQACEEITVDLRDPATGIAFAVVARAYDAGCAVRYRLRQGVTLGGEATGFNLPPGVEVYSSRDEGEYQRSTPAALAPVAHPDLTGSSDVGPLADLPVTVVLANGSALLIAESDRLHYPRAMLRPAVDPAEGLAVHLMHYPGRATGWSGPGDTPPAPTFALDAGQATPWRVLILADNVAGLIERADLIPTLATPNLLGDVSWVKPGRAVRIRKPYSTEAALKVVAFAAARKLDYVEFDAHWYGDGTDPGDATVPIAGLDLQRIIDTARAQGIGMILYVDRVPAMRQRDAILETYRRWGVAGIKFGFVWEGRQADNDFIFDLVKACGEHRLLVNLHDNLRPAGLERTLPNYVALEGVRGNEQFPTARHNVTLPFTRAAAGPIDYTICYANPKNQTTNAHQLAMAAVYYNPLTFLYWYDTPDKYAGRAWPDLRWFDECPTTWDETRALSGAIGEHVVVARRHGQRWFLGAMTNESPRVLKAPLAFLGRGRWMATVFADGPAAARAFETPVVIRKVPVTAATVLSLALAPGGGQAILFEPL